MKSLFFGLLFILVAVKSDDDWEPRFVTIHDASLEIYYDWQLNVTDFIFNIYSYTNPMHPWPFYCLMMKWNVAQGAYKYNTLNAPYGWHNVVPLHYPNTAQYQLPINSVNDLCLICCNEDDSQCGQPNDGKFEFPATRNAVQLTIPPLTGHRVDRTSAYVDWRGHHLINLFETDSYELQWSTSNTFTAASSLTVTIPSALRHAEFPPLPIEYQSATVSSLTTASTYYFRVRALNTLWPSDWSNTLSLFIAGEPDAPSASSVVQSWSSVNVSWSAGATNGGSVTEWDIICGLDSQIQTAILSWFGLASTPLWKSVDLPTPGETWYCRVRGTSEFGTSTWSAPTSFDLVWTPAAPTNLVSSPLTPTSVVVTWENPEEIIEQEDSTVQYSTSSSFTSVTSQNVAGAGNVAFITSLTPAATYYFRVRASNVAGESSWSESTSLTLPSAPSFTPFTTFVEDASTTTEVSGSHSVLPDTLGDREFSVYGDGFITFGNLKMYLESSDSEISYELEILTANSTYVHGVIPSGVGANLHFRAVSGAASSALSDDKVSFPAPTITSGTLRRPGGSNENPLPALTALGEVLIFDGANFGTNVDFVQVQYGPTSTPTLYTAEVQELLDDQLTVLTQSSTSGTRDNKFTVTVGGQAVTGVDIYNYAATPSISSVTGCPTTAGSGTSDCVTSGGTTITVSGTGFTKSLYITVGGLLCTSLSVNAPTSATCSLPALGTGAKAVVAIQDDLFSTPVNYVTYA